MTEYQSSCKTVGSGMLQQYVSVATAKTFARKKKSLPDDTKIHQLEGPTDKSSLTLLCPIFHTLHLLKSP